MKKTLVALAALAAVGAYAQTTVVIDGYFDRGYLSTNNNDNTKDLTTVASNAGTTTVGIKVRENLGGGLSVGGSVNTDWADLGGATQANAVANAQGSGFANSQSFLDVTGNFGVIRLGAPNNFTLTNATAVATPAFSTAIGSSYSSSFSIANGINTGTSGFGGTANLATTSATAAATGARAIRIANTVQYSSPSFNGLTAHIGITPQNNNLASTTSAGNTVGVTEYALRYTAGPIDAMYTSIKYEVGSNGTTQTKLTASTGTAAAASLATNNTLAANLKSTQNLLGATYQVMPALKLHAGIGTFTSSDDANKGKSTSLGATYTMGAWDILGQMASVDDTSTTDGDRKMTGLGVNYNFSKTARAYVRYDSIKYAYNQTAFAGNELTRTAVGVSKSF
jgi:predicted porin